MSPGIEFLIASRVVQGIGGAIILPIGLTIVTTNFPAERRGTAIGILEGVSGLAVIAGPLTGGGITSLVGWQGIFWVNVPIIVVAIPFMRRTVTESYGTDDGLDPAGLVLATIAAGAAVWALVRGNEVGWVSAEAFAAGSAALIAGAAFAVWELRAAHPMIPPRLCRRRNFTVGLGTAMLLSASLYGVVFFMAQFLQTSQGASPWGAALRLLPWTATLFLIAPIAGHVADGVGPRRVLAVGLAVQAGGLTWLYAVAGVDASYLAMLPALIVTGVGASAALPVSQLAIIEAVPDPDVGRAVGVNNMLQEVGGSVGVALTVAGFGLWGGGTAPEAFADGFRAVLLVGSGLSAIGAMLALGLRTRPSAEARVPKTERRVDSVAGAPACRTAAAGATS
jgi:EmrB/QacA subfamily drug resistance transporter